MNEGRIRGTDFNSEHNECEQKRFERVLWEERKIADDKIGYENERRRKGDPKMIGYDGRENRQRMRERRDGRACWTEENLNKGPQTVGHVDKGKEE